MNLTHKCFCDFSIGVCDILYLYGPSPDLYTTEVNNNITIQVVPA